MPEDLDQVDMGEDVDRPGRGQFRLEGEVLLVGPANPASGELGHHLGMIERPASDPVHRADEQVPGIRGDQLEHRIDRVGKEVDLETEEHREPPISGGDHGLDVGLETQRAILGDEALGLLGQVVPGLVVPESPQDRARLDTAIEMLRETDSLLAQLDRPIDVGVDVPRWIDPGLRAQTGIRPVMMEMQVVIAQVARAADTNEQRLSTRASRSSSPAGSYQRSTALRTERM